MNLQDFRDFSSWDEIQPGDILTWWRDDRYAGCEVSFISRRLGTMVAKVVIGPISSGKETEEYCDDIYHHQGYMVNQGWKVRFTERPYDPTQAGDTDEDI